MEQRYKNELNKAFREFIRCLDNAQENDDEGFVGKVMFDLRSELNKKGIY